MLVLKKLFSYISRMRAVELFWLCLYICKYDSSLVTANTK